MSEISKLNGYDLKDKTARTTLTEHTATLSEHTNTLNSHDNKFNFVINSKTLFIGDSYALGTNPNSETLTPWPVIVKNLMGLSDDNYKLVAEAGSGFLRQGTSNHTFLELLQFEIDNISNKDSYKNIILCGGYNDNTYNNNDIKSAINTFINYCNTQFPNATIYIGCIGYRREISSAGAVTRSGIATSVYPAYANNVSSSPRKYVYLNGVENILKANPTTYMYEDNAHPNQMGQNQLGQGIYQSLKTGYVQQYSSNSMTLSNNNASEITGTIQCRKNGDICQIAVTSLKVKFTEESETQLSVSTLFVLGDYTCNNFIGGISNDYNIAECLVSIQDYDIGRHTLPGYIMFTNDGKIKLFTWNTATTTSSGTSVEFNKVKEIEIFRCKCLIPMLFS